MIPYEVLWVGKKTPYVLSESKEIIYCVIKTNTKFGFRSQFKNIIGFVLKTNTKLGFWSTFKNIIGFVFNTHKV